MHQYTECYLYYSCMENECDERIRKIWERMFDEEVAHLRNGGHMGGIHGHLRQTNLCRHILAV